MAIMRNLMAWMRRGGASTRHLTRTPVDVRSAPGKTENIPLDSTLPERECSSLTALSLMQDAVRTHGDGTAVLGAHRSWTYRAIWEEGRAFAAYLHGGMGLNECSRVGLALSDTHALLVALIGCWRVGCLPLFGASHSAPPNPMSGLDGDCLDALIVDESCVPLIGGRALLEFAGRTVFVRSAEISSTSRTQPSGSIDFAFAVARGLASPVPDRLVLPEHHAIGQITSSNGRAVVYTHEQVRNAVRLLAELTGVRYREEPLAVANLDPVSCVTNMAALLALAPVSGGTLLSGLSCRDALALGGQRPFAIVSDIVRMRTTLDELENLQAVRHRVEYALVVDIETPSRHDSVRWRSAGNDNLQFAGYQAGLLSPITFGVAGTSHGAVGLGRLVPGIELCAADGSPPLRLEDGSMTADAIASSLIGRPLELAHPGSELGLPRRIVLERVLSVDRLGVVYACP